jgi:regulatory protein
LAADRVYLDALALLARRELSEAQLRERLARRRHASADVDEAVRRLVADGTLDDRRVAAAIAAREAGRKGRGRRRVVQAIERAGIPRDTADRAAADAFDGVDEDAHLQAALDRRLRGRLLRDEAEFARLYRFLLAQGFDTDRIVAALKARRRR